MEFYSTCLKRPFSQKKFVFMLLARNLTSVARTYTRLFSLTPVCLCRGDGSDVIHSLIYITPYFLKQGENGLFYGCRQYFLIYGLIKRVVQIPSVKTSDSNLTLTL